MLTGQNRHRQNDSRSDEGTGDRATHAIEEHFSAGEMRAARRGRGRALNSTTPLVDVEFPRNDGMSTDSSESRRGFEFTSSG
jgi:hypothetical protein